MSENIYLTSAGKLRKRNSITGIDFYKFLHYIRTNYTKNRATYFVKKCNEFKINTMSKLLNLEMDQFKLMFRDYGTRLIYLKILKEYYESGAVIRYESGRAKRQYKNNERKRIYP